MASTKKYWRSVEELNNPSLKEELASNEFAEDIPVEDFLGNEQAMTESNTSRRDFLKLLGFSSAAVTLAACEAPVVKSIPYVVKPENVTPGVPTFFASTFFNGYDYANVIVKTREGRPIKIEPNKTANYFGKTTARAQASVLSLYDSDKLAYPKVDGKKVDWQKADKLIKAELSKVAASGKKTVLLTPSIPSPSTKELISSFTSKYGNVEHIVFDATSSSSALDAADTVYGKRVLPYYDLSKADLVVSFGADFLGDYNGGGMESAYAARRKPSENMLRHVQLEGNMSLTGANADTRLPMKPSEYSKVLAEVYAGLNGGAVKSAEAKSILKELTAKGSKAVVFAEGSKEAYVLAYAINAKLGSEVVSKDKVTLLKESDDTKYNTFVSELKSKQIGAVITYDVNPVYASSTGEAFAKAFEALDFSVSLCSKEDETSSLAKVKLPVSTWLESWGDFNPVTGVYSLQQPTIQKIFDSRQFQTCLLSWSDTPGSYYGYLKSKYESKLSEGFKQGLFDGVSELSETESISASTGAAAEAAAKLMAVKSSGFELELYNNTSIGDGAEANNPWLQELPDPITRASWDNYITMSPKDVEELDIKSKLNKRMALDAGYVSLTVGNTKFEKVPVFKQPGQAVGTIGLALGYGREKGGKVCNGVGVNAYPLLVDGAKHVLGVSLEKQSGTHDFACIQLQNTLMGRYEIAKDVTLTDFLGKDKKEWNEDITMPTHEGSHVPVSKVDIWRTHDDTIGPKFNLSIDLNSCTACGACVISCQAENNTPVVGKDEIRRSRDMYWLRIDRYYSSEVPPNADLDGDGKLTQTEAIQDEFSEPEQYKYLIEPEANPEVTFQPVMCQHCNHAPCETVCPVAATSHGRQGQNMMAYNRCVGTRYCANNCPYKVRRFNWFNYAANDKFDFNMNDDLGRMVLNPDVVVRSRGVMEKCSMCIQMTQYAISTAKKEGRRLKDDEVQTACSNACPTGAIVFGDINDEASEVSKLEQDDRKYVLLEEVGTKPNVFYQVKVRNDKQA